MKRQMAESWKTRLARLLFNLYPVYRGTGGKILYIRADWKEVKISLPLSLRTKNYVGTIFGGSMYSSVDPIYMLMLIKILGPGFVVWDKSAAIRFKKPGKSTLYAHFQIADEEIEAILKELEFLPSIDRVYKVELKDCNDEVHAIVEKTIYIARRKEKGGR